MYIGGDEHFTPIVPPVDQAEAAREVGENLPQAFTARVAESHFSDTEEREIVGERDAAETERILTAGRRAARERNERHALERAALALADDDVGEAHVVVAEAQVRRPEDQGLVQGRRLPAVEEPCPLGVDCLALPARGWRGREAAQRDGRVPVANRQARPGGAPGRRAPRPGAAPRNGVLPLAPAPQPDGDPVEPQPEPVQDMPEIRHGGMWRRLGGVLLWVRDACIVTAPVALAWRNPSWVSSGIWWFTCHLVPRVPFIGAHLARTSLSVMQTILPKGALVTGAFNFGFVNGLAELWRQSVGGVFSDVGVRSAVALSCVFPPLAPIVVGMGGVVMYQSSRVTYMITPEALDPRLALGVLGVGVLAGVVASSVYAQGVPTLPVCQAPNELVAALRTRAFLQPRTPMTATLLAGIARKWCEEKKVEPESVAETYIADAVAGAMLVSNGELRVLEGVTAPTNAWRISQLRHWRLGAPMLFRPVLGLLDSVWWRKD